MIRKIRKYLLACDPSINHFGLAVFKDRKLESYRLLHPKKSSVEYREKALDLYRVIKTMQDSIGIDQCDIIMETTQTFGVAGYLSRESGAIVKLSFLGGMIYTLPNVSAVTPSEWKGNLPKKVCAARLDSVHPELKAKEMNDNIVDAISIGLWFIHGKI